MYPVTDTFGSILRIWEYFSHIHTSTEVGQSPLFVVLMEYPSNTDFSAFHLLWVYSHSLIKGDAPKLTSISSTKQWQLYNKILNEWD